jgi:adenylate cyclase
MSGAEATFLFADIAGFTALTEAHGDEDAAQLAAEFCDDVKRVAPEYGGEHVKNIGDALMLRLPDPARATELGLRITHELMCEHGSPSVRVGLHHGPAVERDRDYFGAAVNLAARVSGEASANDVLMTAETAELAGELPGVTFESRGRRQLRHIQEPVELVAAVRTGDETHGRFALDPVCRMAVDPQHAAGRLEHRDETHWFCSLECAAAFARDPDSYLR